MINSAEEFNSPCNPLHMGRRLKGQSAAMATGAVSELEGHDMMRTASCRHLDADEAVVLGAGLFAANLSTTFRLRKFGMADGATYPLMFQVTRPASRTFSDMYSREFVSSSEPQAKHSQSYVRGHPDRCRRYVLSWLVSIEVP